MTSARRIPSLQRLMRGLLDRADEQLLAGVYTAVSPSTPGVRRWLRRAGRTFVDPEDTRIPTLWELDETARWVVEQYAVEALAVGGVAGVAGAVSVPPEVAATLIRGVRLAHCLAVVYGFDPTTERGEMALWRGLAAGFEVELPTGGPLGMRVSELGDVIGPVEVPDSKTLAGLMVRRAVRRTVWRIAGRVTRFIPVLATGLAATNARQAALEMGERMIEVLRRLAEVPLAEIGMIEDAVEVTSG